MMEVKGFCRGCCGRMSRKELFEEKDDTKFNKLSLKGIVDDHLAGTTSLRNSLGSVKISKIKSQENLLSFNSPNRYPFFEANISGQQPRENSKRDNTVKPKITLDFNKRRWETVMNKQNNRICLALSDRTTRQKLANRQMRQQLIRIRSQKTQKIQKFSDLSQIQKEIQETERQYNQKIRQLEFLRDRLVSQ